MKKKKLNLRNLKVSSFVTQSNADLKGGAITGTVCDPTDATRCFVCPPLTFEKTCDPTDATYCFVCPPFTADGCEK